MSESKAPGAIENESPQRMLDLIRMCHPNEHGEPYGRFDVIVKIDSFFP